MIAGGLVETKINIMRIMQYDYYKKNYCSQWVLRSMTGRHLKEKISQLDKNVPYLEVNNLCQCNKILKAIGYVAERLKMENRRKQILDEKDGMINN